MKRMFLAFLLLACVSFALADVYTIGTGTSTQNYVPFYGLYDYGWSKTIYTAEINTSGLATARSLIGIGFEVGNTPLNYTILDQRVYLRTTTQDCRSVNIYVVTALQNVELIDLPKLSGINLDFPA